MEYKIVIIGGEGVGKSSLLIHFTKHHFPEDHVPTVFDYTQPNDASAQDHSDVPATVKQTAKTNFVELILEETKKEKKRPTKEQRHAWRAERRINQRGPVARRR